MSTLEGRKGLTWTTGPLVVMFWLHQGVRAERTSLTAWYVKTMRYKPLQGSFSQAPHRNTPLGSSQHTNVFSPCFPLVLREICIPTAAARSSLEEESGCEIHEDGVGSGLSKDECSQGDHEHPVADLGPPAVYTGGQGMFRGDLHTNICSRSGERGSAFQLPDCSCFLDLRELGLNQAEP